MCAFWLSLRPVSPKTVKPIACASLTKSTMPGVAGKRSPSTQGAWAAGVKTNFMSPTSIW